MLNYGGKRKCKYGPIAKIFIVTIGEIEMPHSPAFASNFGEVGGVRVDGENHVTSMVVDAGVGVHCDVIKELVACFRDCLGSVGLLRLDCA